MILSLLTQILHHSQQAFFDGALRRRKMHLPFARER
jgi:hypothetical protein